MPSPLLNLQRLQVKAFFSQFSLTSLRKVSREGMEGHRSFFLSTPTGQTELWYRHRSNTVRVKYRSGDLYTTHQSSNTLLTRWRLQREPVVKEAFNLVVWSVCFFPRIRVIYTSRIDCGTAEYLIGHEITSWSQNIININMLYYN